MNDYQRAPLADVAHAIRTETQKDARYDETI